MEPIYTFNGKDITLNVCIQIRGVVNELQKRLNISFPDAMLLFYRSETYKVLQQIEKCILGGICGIYCRSIFWRNGYWQLKKLQI